jgi:uncharacterized protein YndB with AHSA1/START domain
MNTFETQPLIIERTFEAPLDLVWKAISEREAFDHWYFKLKDFQAKVGFEFEFSGEDKGVTYLHHCRVTEVVPGKKLSYTWRYEGHEGQSLVTFELFPEGDQKTKLRLTHAGLETFPKLPSFARENFLAGWTDIIGRSLKKYVEEKAG